MNEDKAIDYLNLTVDEMNRRRAIYEKDPKFAHLFYHLDIVFVINSYAKLKDIISSNSDETCYLQLKKAIRNFDEAHKGLCMELAYNQEGNPIHETSEGAIK